MEAVLYVVYLNLNTRRLAVRLVCVLTTYWCLWIEAQEGISSYFLSAISDRRKAEMWR